MRLWLLLTGLALVAALIFLALRRPIAARFLLGLVLPVCVVTAIFWAAGRPQFWQSQIAAYAQVDQASPPPPGVIVFAGGSSIRKWTTLSADMKPLKVINRGCGGCELSHVTYYARQIVVPYRPRAIVLYAGDNDLADPPWKSPETVLNEFGQFVSLIHGELPETWIFYVSMKPAPWGDWPLMEQANRMIEAYSRTQKRVQFIDVSRAMLDSQGKLRRELYDWDPMHMNASGYALWTSIVKPVLMKQVGAGSPAS
jgi:GDSL-like lipase/acylhydrolase family protein